MYVNTIIVRLADAFKDGTNPLRTAIARVLSECESHLSLVFSGSEIFQTYPFCLSFERSCCTSNDIAGVGKPCTCFSREQPGTPLNRGIDDG
ncbi:hypothetical protein KIN20_001239 [Parelaphostrongylus tenuis]|uniref:Uncharacterized protein n=1 Tax=Parelaphostrongylus tenuis TaxID=148309 RepID=A0AAD5LXT7_PARTN|nr:hypothetical protein KIN20_001239 [Parelaphostrongylus tenuis]